MKDDMKYEMKYEMKDEMKDEIGTRGSVQTWQWRVCVTARSWCACAVNVSDAGACGLFC